MKKSLLPLPFILIGCLISCQKKSDLVGTRPYENDAFKQYWYAGKAEIDAYVLNQSRYGENRKGKAVLIFITEDFSKKKQVKLDNPSVANNDNVNVLKMNFTKNFVTGIYPYSMMLSVFTPVSRNQYPNTIKVTMSSQEWCGHVFDEMNLHANKFNVKSYSYLEREGDQNFTIKKVLLEDELWNIIRIDHQSLPTGEINILPGLFFFRLNLVNLKATKATAEKTESDSSFTYTVNYPEHERKLRIQFEKTFPYKILNWTEEFKEGNGKVMLTSGVLDKTLYTDYWTKNKNEFNYLRDSLGLYTDH